MESGKLYEDFKKITPVIECSSLFCYFELKSIDGICINILLKRERASYFIIQFNFKTMQESKKIQSRKKFLLWSAAALSSVSVLKFFKAPKKKNSETVKMLTQDGKLVEVNISAIPSKKKKITNKELQNWITKDKV